MKNIVIKEKENWLPKNKLLIIQLIVSIASYITLPFFKPRVDGSKKFFQANYSVNHDSLIFDGSTKGYYSKIERIVNIDSFRNKIIFDIGCGNGNLLKWFMNQSISFEKYIGIDFAIKISTEIKNADFILDDVANISKYLQGFKSRIFFLSNVACYLNDELFIGILNSLKIGDEIVIIDPSPNIFWDAHFKGIKPIYRKINKMKEILISNHFVIINDIQDYALRTKKYFFFPLSYGIVAIKNN